MWASECTRDKLVVGIPTYGRGFTLADSNKAGLNATTTGPSPAGEFTREEGFYSYYEVRIIFVLFMARIILVRIIWFYSAETLTNIG